MPYFDIQYSEKYEDDLYEYRHVMLPNELAKLVPRTHLLTETEWRNLGVQQSPNWQHYMIHFPEMHVLLFRRPKVPIIESRADVQGIVESTTHIEENNKSTKIEN